MSPDAAGAAPETDAPPRPPSPWRRAQAAGWWVLWSLPLLTGVYGRLFHAKTAPLVDWGSVVCAAERVVAGLPLYGAGAKCPGVAMSTYVYPPWVAQALAPAVRAFGSAGGFAPYAPLFAGGLALLLWSAFAAAWTWAPRRRRAPFLALVGWNPVVVGNVAVVQQAAVVAAGLWGGAASLPFAVVIALAALIKPTALAFCACILFAPASLARRIGLCALACAPVVLLVALDVDGAGEWRRFAFGEAIGSDPGGGALRWLDDAGLRGVPALAASAVYGAALLAAGRVLAARGGLEPRARLFLGVTVAILATPRVVAYDLLPLAPGWLAAAAALELRSPVAAHRLRIWGTACCALYLVASVGGGKLKLGHDAALAGLALGLAAAASLTLRSGPARGAECAAPLPQDQRPAMA